MKIINQLREADDLELKLGDLKEEILQEVSKRVIRWLHIIKNDPVQKLVDLPYVLESMKGPNANDPVVEEVRLMMDDRVHVKVYYGNARRVGIYLDKRILADDDEGFAAIETMIQSRIDTHRMLEERNAIEAEKRAKAQRRAQLRELLNEFGPEVGEVVNDWIRELGLPKKEG